MNDQQIKTRLRQLSRRVTACIDNKKKEKTQAIQAKEMGYDSASNLSKYRLKDDPDAKTPIMGVDNLIRIADYYKVSTDYLLGFTDDKFPLRKDGDNLIREICDYTGLSRQAVEALHKEKDNFLFSAGLTYLLTSKGNLLPNLIEYILTCLHDVCSEDKRYSLLPGISSSSEMGKHFLYDIIEELPQARTNFYNLVMGNEVLRERYAREMALKYVDRKEVFNSRYPNLPYEPELSSEELYRKNQEVEEAIWSELFSQDDTPYDFPEPQFDENDPLVIRDKQYDGFLEDLRNHLAEKNKA